MPIKDQSLRHSTSGRSLFLPKRPEVPAQCVGCPFRFGNDKELKKILDLIRKVNSMPPVRSAAELLHARLQVEQDIAAFGDFCCHETVYNADGTLKPQSQWRQCRGATSFYRNSKPQPLAHWEKIP